MNNIALSYIVSKNKLPFLKYALKRLIKNIQPDEEIIVIDAGSVDGTVPFVEELKNDGLIDQFVSEVDKGEAHGYNKGLLLAKGVLIKVISDDDFFNYKAIQECKQVMLSNTHIDVMIGNVDATYIDDFDKIYCEDMVEDNFKNYLNTGETFSFTGLSLMIRKKSISFTGLFLTNIISVDTEFAQRITQIGAKIGWSDALIGIRIENPRSNLLSVNKEFQLDELDRFYYFHDKRYRKRKNSVLYLFYRKTRSAISKFINMVISFVYKKEIGLDFMKKDNQFSKKRLYRKN